MPLFQRTAHPFVCLHAFDPFSVFFAEPLPDQHGGNVGGSSISSMGADQLDGDKSRGSSSASEGKETEDGGQEQEVNGEEGVGEEEETREDGEKVEGQDEDQGAQSGGSVGDPATPGPGTLPLTGPSSILQAVPQEGGARDGEEEGGDNAGWAWGGDPGSPADGSGSVEENPAGEQEGVEEASQSSSFAGAETVTAAVARGQESAGEEGVEPEGQGGGNSEEEGGWAWGGDAETAAALEGQSSTSEGAGVIPPEGEETEVLAEVPTDGGTGVGQDGSEEPWGGDPEPASQQEQSSMAQGATGGEEVVPPEGEETEDVVYEAAEGDVQGADGSEDGGWAWGGAAASATPGDQSPTAQGSAGADVIQPNGEETEEVAEEPRDGEVVDGQGGDEEGGWAWGGDAESAPPEEQGLTAQDSASGVEVVEPEGKGTDVATEVLAEGGEQEGKEDGGWAWGGDGHTGSAAPVDQIPAAQDSAAGADVVEPEGQQTEQVVEEPGDGGVAEGQDGDVDGGWAWGGHPESASQREGDPAGLPADGDAAPGTLGGSSSSSSADGQGEGVGAAETVGGGGDHEEHGEGSVESGASLPYAAAASGEETPVVPVAGGGSDYPAPPSGAASVSNNSSTVDVVDGPGDEEAPPQGGEGTEEGAGWNWGGSGGGGGVAVNGTDPAAVEIPDGPLSPVPQAAGSSTGQVGETSQGGEGWNWGEGAAIAPTPAVVARSNSSSVVQEETSGVPSVEGDGGAVVAPGGETGEGGGWAWGEGAGAPTPANASSVETPGVPLATEAPAVQLGNGTAGSDGLLPSAEDGGGEGTIPVAEGEGIVPGSGGGESGGGWNWGDGAPDAAAVPGEV